jgi:hypothetical protein
MEFIKGHQYIDSKKGDIWEFLRPYGRTDGWFRCIDPGEGEGPHLGYQAGYERQLGLTYQWWRHHKSPKHDLFTDLYNKLL